MCVCVCVCVVNLLISIYLKDFFCTVKLFCNPSFVLFSFSQSQFRVKLQQDQPDKIIFHLQDLLMMKKKSRIFEVDN